MDSENKKDLMVSDVFGVMSKMIFSIIIIWVVTVVGFIGYIIYKDYKHNETINRMNQQYTDFINSFDLVNQSYTQDGNGYNIVGDNNTTYGANGKNKDSEKEKQEGEISTKENNYIPKINQ